MFVDFPDMTNWSFDSESRFRGGNTKATFVLWSVQHARIALMHVYCEIVSVRSISSDPGRFTFFKTAEVEDLEALG